MNRQTYCAIALLSVAMIQAATCSAQTAALPVSPDSVAKDGVPKGTVSKAIEWRSKIYPGTVRNYYVYVPSQYKADKPACVFVVQDGLRRAEEWKLPTVMDNLIHAGAMPVTIGIFIDPGVVPAPNEEAQPRFNRSFEYDGLSDRYAKFLIDEILPEVSKSYNLSTDPNDRAIGGASSGAICAFNVAWERPDQFRRVMSTIGTYVGLRGADELSTLVRKTEPKPLRVFLEDGDKDLNIYGGDWWISNLQMRSALEYAGYDVHHAWGTGGHDGNHATSIMPDAMRWLWRDYPNPIQAGTLKTARLNVLIPDQGWELVSQGHQFTEGPAVDNEGTFYFVDVSTNKIFRVGDSKGKPQVELFNSDSGGASGLMLGPDGKMYACQSGKKQIVRYSLDGKEEVVVADSPCNDLVVTSKGIYYTDPGSKKLFHVTFAGVKTEVDKGISYGNGLIVSPDQTLLHVADSDGRFTFCFQIQADGTLAHKQEFGYLHTPDGTTKSQADGMSMDINGNLYVATNLGIQVLDPLGRVNQIIPKPQNAFLSNVAFAGENRDVMYVTCGDKVYKRKVNARGNDCWKAPIKPPKPGL